MLQKSQPPGISKGLEIIGFQLPSGGYVGILWTNASHINAEGLRDFSDAPSFALTACFARGVPRRFCPKMKGEV